MIIHVSIFATTYAISVLSNPGYARTAETCRDAQTQRHRVQEPRRPRWLVFSAPNSPPSPSSARRQGHRSRVQPNSILHLPPSTQPPPLLKKKETQLNRHQSLSRLSTAPSVSLSFSTPLTQHPPKSNFRPSHFVHLVPLLRVNLHL